MKEHILNQDEPLSEQQPKKVVQIEMFRAGPQISSTGQKMMFTEKDLDGVIEGYDVNKHEAPLIIGHDQQDDTPALGWVREVWRKGESLWGKVQLTPKAEQLIKDGVFKKVSSSFYLPEAENNPSPGKLTLRHLGLVPIPAVKGLTAFSEITEDTITTAPTRGEFSISFKESLENTVIMARKAARKTETPAQSTVDHGEMTVNINIGTGSGDGKDSKEVYDSTGGKVQETGAAPAAKMEYGMEEDDEADSSLEEETSDMDMDPEGADPDAEGEDDDMGGEEDAPEDGEDDPDMDTEDPTAEDEGADTEDISGDVDGADERIAQLASEYDITELIKALAMAAESSNMTEQMNYSELPEGLRKHMESKGHSEEDEDEEKTSEHAEEHEDEDEDEEKTSEHAEEHEDEEDEKVDHSCGDTYAEEPDKKATGALKYSEKAVRDHGTDELRTRVAELEAELAHQKKVIREKEISDFVEGVYTSGKLVEGVVGKTDLVRFMETLNAKNSVNFSEKGKVSQFEFFKEVLTNLPSMVSFTEQATPASAPPKKTTHRTPSVDGFVCDPAQAELHDKALSYAEDHGVDFATAIKAVITEAESI